MGFSRQEYWNGLPFPSSGDLPKPGIELHGWQTLYCLSHYGSPKVHVLAERKHYRTSQFSSLQSLRCVQLCETLQTAAHQASPSITNSWSLLRLMAIESVMPSNHLILCHPLLLPSIFPSIRVFSNESVLHIRWPKCWSFSFSISPSNEYS